MRLSVRSVLPVLALASSVIHVSAQTFSNCNPLYNSEYPFFHSQPLLTDSGGCPADTALGRSASYNFAGGASNDFTASQNPTYDSNGAAFTVAQQGNSPTLTSKWYIMFGHVEWVVKAAPGTGIVSSAVLISDCLDEIDFEWLGGDNDQVQSNYFGKGITTAYNRGAFHGATNNHDQFHTYTVDWTSDRIVWQVDGVTVRVQTAASADAGQYPQTPMQVRMGVWAGGDSSNPPGTISWAGGQTDYSAGPFTMYVKSVKVTDYSTGSQYTYSGSAGTWQSINSQGGRVNPQGDGTPVSTADAPAITSAVSGSAPLAFDPSDSASAAATRTGWPWVLDSATASAVTAVSSVYTSIAGLPSGWTITDSGKVIPPSSGAISSCSVLRAPYTFQY
jgi:Glycosyl hydrolases family 16